MLKESLKLAAIILGFILLVFVFGALCYYFQTIFGLFSVAIPIIIFVLVVSFIFVWLEKYIWW